MLNAQLFKKLKHMRYIVFILVMFFPKIIFTQNLVLDPSFENLISCPTSTMQGYLLKDWFTLTSGTPDLYNSCSNTVGVPSNQTGYQMPYTGNGYIEITGHYFDFSPDLRGYIEGTFSSPLIKDSLYCVSYYVNLTDISGGAIQNFDAYLSDTLVDWNNGVGWTILGITPQIKSKVILNDSINWTRINDLYRAKGGEKYITIGNFVPGISPSYHCFNPQQPCQVRYFLDEVTVTPVTAPPLILSDTLLCHGFGVHTLQAPVGFSSYLWSTADTTMQINITDTGTYWIKCGVDDCGFLYDTLHVGYLPYTALQLPADTTLCLQDTFTINLPLGFSTYNWSNGHSNSSINITTDGAYIVTVTDNCGSQSDTINIEIDSLPYSNIYLGADTTICSLGIDVPFTLVPNYILSHYLWNDGTTEPQITIDKGGIYWLNSDYYCGTLADTIDIASCSNAPVVFIPNCFTPNDDGINEYFMAYTANAEIINMQIYNRYGQPIYSGLKWNGMLNNNYVPQSVYGYNIKVKDSDGKIFFYKGSFSVVY